MHGDVTHFLCNGIRTDYEHINIWGVQVYIINGRVTIKKCYNRLNKVYFMIYATTTGGIIY